MNFIDLRTSDKYSKIACVIIDRTFHEGDMQLITVNPHINNVSPDCNLPVIPAFMMITLVQPICTLKEHQTIQTLRGLRECRGFRFRFNNQYI